MQQLDSLKDRYLDSLGETNRNIIIKKVTFNDSMYVVVDGLVLIDVEEVDELIRHEKSITLKYDGSEIGALLITDINKNIYDFSDLTSSEIIYLISKKFLGENLDSVKFEKNFVLIKEDFLIKYIRDFYETSSFWGKYSHDSKSHNFVPQISEIEIPENIFKFPTPFHKNTSINNLISVSPFDKYLKTYHQIELLFNLIMVKAIQKIDISSINNINSIYKDLGKNEFETIVYIIDKYSKIDEKYLKIIVDGFANNENLCEEFLQKYSKSSNPLSDIVRWEKFKKFAIKSNQSGCISLDDFFNIACDENVAFSKPTQKQDFINIIRRINGYWIYRIRCSIAHNKLGEFIFESNESHYEFVYNYGLPLLTTTLSCIFADKDFEQLFS